MNAANAAHGTNGHTGYPLRGAAVPKELPLTAGMARDLERVREFEQQHGHLPSPVEFASLYGMRNSSADGALCRLAAAGVLGPRRPYRYSERASWSPAEAELRRARDFIREADEIMAVISVNDRPRRDSWRRRASHYLAGG